MQTRYTEPYFRHQPRSATSMSRYYWQPTRMLMRLGFKTVRLPVNYRDFTGDEEALLRAALAEAAVINKKVSDMRQASQLPTAAVTSAADAATPAGGSPARVARPTYAMLQSRVDDLEQAAMRAVDFIARPVLGDTGQQKISVLAQLRAAIRPTPSGRRSRVSSS